MVLFAAISALIIVTAVFLAAVMTALITAERRSRQYVGQLEHKINHLIDTNMSSAERAQALNRKRRIEEQNRQAHGMYSN